MPRANRHYIPGYVWHITHSKWTESIAVGSKVFIEAAQKRLGIKAKGRKIVGSKKSYELRESAIPYGDNFASENGLLRLQNMYFWHDNN